MKLTVVCKNGYNPEEGGNLTDGHTRTRTSPWPSCPRRPSPHVNTRCSEVSAMMCVLLTDTYELRRGEGEIF